MPAAMRRTVLVSLFAVLLFTVCAADPAASTADVQPTTSTSTRSEDTSLSKATNTENPPTASDQVTTAVTSEAATSRPSSTASPQTPNATQPSTPTQTTQTTQTTDQTNNGTVSNDPTLEPELPELTHTTDIAASAHTTSQDFSHNLGKSDLEASPGVVVILSIFIIVVTLILVVVTVKCIRSPRSNFERLEDMPLGKVNEESPFAHYSK